MEQGPFMRGVAHKIALKELQEGTFVKGEAEFEASYIQTPSNKKVSRIHTVGILTNKGANDFTLDDGSTQILIRSFETIPGFESFTIGDCIRVIAKPRQFQNQTYLSPEICKKVTNPKWLEFARLELQKNETKKEQPKSVQDESIQTTAQDNPTSVDSLIKLIKELDQGSGVLVEDLIAKTGSNDTEQKVSQLLREGELFEMKPGRVKVLD